MKLPRKINIKGVKYKLRISRSLKDENDKYLDGLCDSNTKTIYISRKVPEDQKLAVFLHECFHAVLSECGVYNAQVSDDIEEIIVDNLSRFISENFGVTIGR